MDRFRWVVEHAPDGVVILVRGTIAFINPTAVRLLGADPATVIGTRILDYLPPADALATQARLGTLFATGADIPPSEYGVLADPRRVVEIKSMLCDWEGERAVIAFARDVTERKAMQEKLVAADRFAALGKLAAGVAHEINNPLAYAQLGVELVLRKLAKLPLATAEREELKDLLGDTAHGLDRIAAVTGDLRTFARHDDTPPGAVDLLRVVDQSLRMVDNELRHRARIALDLPDELLPVMGNASRLEQVFVNLLLNALHALRDPARDVVTVRVAPLDRDRVRAEIVDTGHGIPAAILDRVFDPFFTTKAVGEGMGLGLGVCRNIVEACGGTIEIRSVVDEGTTVVVELPTFRQAHTSSPALAVPALPVAPARRRVLVVDDEPFVRETLAVLLSAHHDATAVDGGPAALAALADAPPGPDVILCDVMMPGMNGMQLYRELAARHPGLERRVVFVTGGVAAAELTAFLAASGARCLAKPFKLDLLLEAIATIAIEPS